MGRTQHHHFASHPASGGNRHIIQASRRSKIARHVRTPRAPNPDSVPGARTDTSWRSRPPDPAPRRSTLRRLLQRLGLVRPDPWY